MVAMAIKDNIFGGDHYCALCGSRTSTKFGPDLFLEGSMEIICRDCGMDHAPELVKLLELAEKNAHCSPAVS